MRAIQQIAATDPKTKGTKLKGGLLIFAAFLLAITLLFHFTANKVRQTAEQSLLAKANTAINGQIVVDDIDLSILGYVEINGVQVLDTAGNPLARIPRVHISYNWSDLLKGYLGPQLIKGVTLEEPEFWLTDHQNHLNWDGLLKTDGKEPSAFSGLVKIEDGRLHFATDSYEKTVEQLTGELDFQQGTQLGLSATGKVDQATLGINGQWGTSGTSEITLSLAGMELAKLGLTTADDPIQLTDGRLDELTVQIGQDATSNTPVLEALTGRFSGVNTTGALVLTQGSAQFEKQGQAIAFTNGQAFYQGQTITAAGQVLTTPSGEKALDFAVQMPAGDPAALLPSLQAGGSLAMQGTVTGTLSSPVFAGNFTLGSLRLGSMLISNINGTFSYTQQILKLLNANGTTIGGSVTASGNIYPDTQQYALSFSGRGLETSQLTEKDVKGPLSLTGTATGSTAAATLQGNFIINNGNAYGISFRTLTGKFIKRGSSEAEVSGPVVTTDFGVFYPEQLTQSVMEKLREYKVPTTRLAVQEKVTEMILDKILH